MRWLRERKALALCKSLTHWSCLVYVKNFQNLTLKYYGQDLNMFRMTDYSVHWLKILQFLVSYSAGQQCISKLHSRPYTINQNKKGELVIGGNLGCKVSYSCLPSMQSTMYLWKWANNLALRLDPSINELSIGHNAG